MALTFWPSDALWRHRSGSILDQVMACCLMAPSYYLNWCWLIKGVLCHSHESNFTRSIDESNMYLEIILFKCTASPRCQPLLDSWGGVMHICVSKLTIIGSDNGLVPGRPQAIIWTDAGMLLIGPLGTNFSEISIDIHTFSFTKMQLKVSSAKRRPFCLGINVLTHYGLVTPYGDTDLGQLWLR